MQLIGHRGCADHGPENTVAAVAAAAERLPAVEVDLRRCGSGEVVAFHDERVDRVTDGSGRVGDRDLGELRELRVQGSDEPVATFAEVLKAVPDGVTLQAELKETGLWPDVRDAAANADVPVRLSSFSAPAIAEVRRADWDPETGLLFGDDPAANLDLAAVLGCENVHPHVEQCLATDVVERARDEGFGVYAWGLDDPSDAPGLAERGVDGVTTDTWDVPGA